jgi:hypothetical protein
MTHYKSSLLLLIIILSNFKFFSFKIKSEEPNRYFYKIKRSEQKISKYLIKRDEKTNLKKNS